MSTKRSLKITRDGTEEDVKFDYLEKIVKTQRINEKNKKVITQIVKESVNYENDFTFENLIFPLYN